EEELTKLIDEYRDKDLKGGLMDFLKSRGFKFREDKDD
ncbi:hypothetical protein LCGC14_3049340, partial [marine sediment metagenome]